MQLAPAKKISMTHFPAQPGLGQTQIVPDHMDELVVQESIMHHPNPGIGSQSLNG
jgi:hypothetical protein